MSTQIVGPVVLVEKWASKATQRNEVLARNAVLVAGLAVTTAVAAQISIPLPNTPVPLTLQTLAVLAGAAALGSVRATLAQGLYLVLALVGLPVLAPVDGSHVSGRAVFSMASLGYVVGFIVASFVVGKIAKLGVTKSSVQTALAFLAGSAVIYLFGATWLAHAKHVSASLAIEWGVRPFLLGDVIKAVLAGALLPSLWKLVRD
jgi:biotin transport system substrate-specific component